MSADESGKRWSHANGDWVGSSVCEGSYTRTSCLLGALLLATSSQVETQTNSAHTASLCVHSRISGCGWDSLEVISLEHWVPLTSVP